MSQICHREELTLHYPEVQVNFRGVTMPVEPSCSGQIVGTAVFTSDLSLSDQRGAPRKVRGWRRKTDYLGQAHSAETRSIAHPRFIKRHPQRKEPGGLSERLATVVYPRLFTNLVPRNLLILLCQVDMLGLG